MLKDKKKFKFLYIYLFIYILLFNREKRCIIFRERESFSFESKIFLLFKFSNSLPVPEMQ